MNAGDINKSLFSHFKGKHTYEFANGYIFAGGGWESDFFSVTSSGYAQEVEVKISRGDFFRDFIKDKHDIFSRLFEKKTFLFQKGSRMQGSLICTYTSSHLVNRLIGIRRFGNYNSVNQLEISNSAEHSDYLDKYKFFDLRQREVHVYAPATRIRFIDLTKVSCPNKFFFCVPEGLVTAQEVPAYAGLMYVKEVDGKNKITVIKNAPFLHKRVLNLDRVLLDKFYFECKRQRNLVSYLIAKNNDLSEQLGVSPMNISEFYFNNEEKDLSNEQGNDV